MANRIKEIRLKRGMSQKILGIELGVSQQNISRYENDIDSIPVDILILMSKYFRVSTDYILGLTNVKHNLEIQMMINTEIDEYFELVEMYKKLNPKDGELIWCILGKMIELELEEKGQDHD